MLSLYATFQREHDKPAVIATMCIEETKKRKAALKAQKKRKKQADSADESEDEAPKNLAAPSPLVYLCEGEARYVAKAVHNSMVDHLKWNETVANAGLTDQEKLHIR